MLFARKNICIQKFMKAWGLLSIHHCNMYSRPNFRCNKVCYWCSHSASSLSCWNVHLLYEFYVHELQWSQWFFLYLNYCEIFQLMCFSFSNQFLYCDELEKGLPLYFCILVCLMCAHSSWLHDLINHEMCFVLVSSFDDCTSGIFLLLALVSYRSF